MANNQGLSLGQNLKNIFLDTEVHKADLIFVSLFSSSRSSLTKLTNGRTSRRTWQIQLLYTVMCTSLTLCRTVPDVDHALQPLEDQIRSQLIPAITAHQTIQLSFPAGLGRISLVNPTKIFSLQHQSRSASLLH